MASFHNVTNEKSSVFEDADYDPDLEARLYAEIYYTNENYQQDYDTTDNDSQNPAASLTSNSVEAASTGNDNFIVDTNPSTNHAFDKAFDQRTVYPSRSWVSGQKGNLSQQFARPVRAKQQRLLAHKDLWLPKEQTRSNASALQNLDDTSLKTRLAEAENFSAAVRRSKEARNFSTPFANKSVDDLNTTAVVNRSNEAGNFSAQFRGGSNNCANISTDLNRPDEGDNFSTQLRNRTTVNRCNDTGTFSPQFGGNSIDCGNSSTDLNRPDVADNFSVRLRSGTTVNRCKETGEFSSQFGGLSINSENLLNTSNCSNVDNFSIRLRSGAAVNRCDTTDNINRQFGGDSNHNEAGIDCLPLGSGSIEVENIRPTGHRFNEARNFSTLLRSHIVDDCNITPVFNHSPISSPQFGGRNAARDRISIVTRSKTAGRRKRFADRAERFVAEALETDLDGEGLFNSYLANQVQNFGYVSENELDDLVERSQLTDHISSVQPSPSRRAIRKAKKLKSREKLRERRRKQRELKRRCNAHLTMDGKYEVVSKKNKLKMREIEPEPVDISSDSDDSILEVPVPPKTPPPVIHLQDSDDDLDTDHSASKKGRKTNSDDSDSEEDDSSKEEEWNCENSPRTSRKSKTAENSVASSSIRQECEDDSGKSGKSRSKKGKKSAEESGTSHVLETDSSADSSAEPIADFALTISRETPKKPRNAENSAAISNAQECEDDSGRSSKNRQKKGKKSVEENREESAISRVSETDSSADSSAEPIADFALTISRETPKKPRNVEISAAISNAQECEEDSGRPSKNRQKKGKKSVEENREESAISRVSETDSSAESSAEPIADSALPISRETPKKTRNAENSAAILNAQECEEDSGRSGKNRQKKGKKSVEENREESAISRVSETDSSAESSAEPIVESSLTISRETPKKPKNAENLQECEEDSGRPSKNRQKKGKKSVEENREESAISRISETDSSAEVLTEPIAESRSTISRETPKKTKNLETSVATPNIQESEEDSGKSAKNRSKKAKKSVEEPREESAVSRISETDFSAESVTEPISKSSLTISQKISRETPKKSKNSENIQECDDDSGKSSKNRQKKGKKSAEEPREETSSSLLSEADFSAENSAEPIADSNATITQKISLPKKNSVATSNEQECEEDSGKSSKSRTKKGKKSAEEPREEMAASQICENSSKDDESSAASIREAKLQKILKDATKKAKDTEIPAAVNPEEGNLILNCTEIQKGASSLQEIKKMREAANLSHAHSDDSMTESEANNWVNISAGQANSSRKDDEICSISSSIDGSINPALWDQLAQENRAAAADSSIEEIEERSAEDFLPIQTTSKSTDFQSPVTNSEAANSRKRQKASSPFNDFDVPAVPEKRAKGRQKNSREQTMTEYFFKPMSKELQAFYNNPWGGENLDVFDVQSRMPRNPNCWAILDADLQGPTSKRRRLCPRCKSDTHFGKRCPEKAKPPCCYMCGAKGHTESRCPHTMCLTCGRKYATYRPTCGYCSQLHCTICNGSGHSCENCPDLWRRYHNTTTSTPPVVPQYASSIMKPSQNLSCCNCAKRGHDVTMCRQLRWSQHFPTPMYISSYTAGPMYEPSHIPPIQQPVIHDLTHELPHQDRYFDADPSNVSILDSSANEILQESNADLSIETIDIPDDSPAPEPEISLPQSRIVFQVGELDPQKTVGWHRAQKRLDTEKGIELTGILSGSVKPAFLLHWQRQMQFGVEITHNSVAGTFLTIACITTKIFKEFEKVIWQWLSRRDAEKAYLFYETNPFEASSELFEMMKIKLVMCRTVLPVVPLLKKIASTDTTLKKTAANIKATKSRKNRRRIFSITGQFDVCANRRNQLITSLYCGNWVEKGDILLQRFRSLARERLHRLQSGTRLMAREYFQLVYAYNEIFSFHQTEALTKALEKAVADFRAKNPTENLSLDLCRFPKAAVQVPIEQSNFLASTIAEIPTNPAVDSLAESLPLLANSAANIDPQLAVEAPKVNEASLNDTQEISGSDSEIPNAETEENPAGSSGGVLIAWLPKKARKNYRRLGKTAIEAANKSNVPRLQNIAKILKKKMAKCTILKDEIDSLQREISIDLGRRRRANGKHLSLQKLRTTTRKSRRSSRQQEQKERQIIQHSHQQQNVACDNDPAYVKFLRNL